MSSPHLDPVARVIASEGRQPLRDIRVQHEIAGIRGAIRSVVWVVLWPVRVFVRYSRWRGRRVATDFLIRPLLPRHSEFIAFPTDNSRIRLRYRESLGIAVLVHGGFERAEVTWVCSRARSTEGLVLDVGANVGYFTVAVVATTSVDRVVAFEPLPDNTARLRANLGLNAAKGVSIVQSAVGDYCGSTSFDEKTDDSAFARVAGQDDPATVQVPVITLDSWWLAAGRPHISMIKIDVEGHEAAVLRGAREMLGACLPDMLIEAHGAVALGAIEQALTGLRYERSQLRGFQPWNYSYSIMAT